MRFLYSDSLDYVDPDFDFEADRAGRSRRAHRDDDFPHEHLHRAPYDGLLVSRAIVGDARKPGKYSAAQGMRFRREGARAFLRYPVEKFPDSMVMGDNGAFTYRNERYPTTTVDETLEFYEDGCFTHGCSIDHLIFDFIPDDAAPSAAARERYEVTLELASRFLPASRNVGGGFVPLGVVQGWSAASMARAARALVAMGYDYLALGGMVPLKMDQIEQALAAVRAVVPRSTRLHVLGFGKTEDLARLRAHDVSSFDTTSPLLRAFKDGRRNYYSARPDGGMDFFTAIRVPQALENDRLMRRARKGRIDQDELVRMERRALSAIRSFAAEEVGVDEAVDTVITYGRYALWDDKMTAERNEARLAELRKSYSRTLSERPWTRCGCRVCRETGVEALIFRSSNRNKRRGFHNLHVFYGQLRETDGVAA